MRVQDAMPQQGRIFAVGDIHGCYRTLIELIDRLPLDRQRDVLVFLGDYINRGPQSREVIDYLLDLRASCARTVFLMGNHEHLLLRYAETADLTMLQHLRHLGVEATLQSYDNASVHSLLDLSFLPPSHRDFLEGLELYFREGPYLFVHADTAERDEPLQHIDELLASRRLATARDVDAGCVIVFGHTAFEAPLVTDDRIGIDTGAVYGNMLTAVELPALRFYHA